MCRQGGKTAEVASNAEYTGRKELALGQQIREALVSKEEHRALLELRFGADVAV